MRNVAKKTTHVTTSHLFRKTALSLLIASGCLYGVAADAQSSLDAVAIAEANATTTAGARVNHGEIVDALSDNGFSVSSASANAAANVAASVEASARQSASAVSDAGSSTSQSVNLNGAADAALNAVVVAASDDEIAVDAGAVVNTVLSADIGAEQSGSNARDAADAVAEQTVTLGADVAANVSSVIDTAASSANDTAESVLGAVDVDAGLDVGVNIAGEVAAASTDNLGDMAEQSGDIGASITSVTDITGSVTGALGL